MPGTLYVVGTPIGNLSDFTRRAEDTLQAVDFICAEDTRVTLKLLNHLEIKKPLVSYHQHSAKNVEESILRRLEEGESCAVVTDAGMPCISDPGEDLVRLAGERGIPIAVVPGPTAALSALAVSGLPTGRFAFEGFLSTSKKQRYAHLQSVKEDTHTLIFYESPHKITDTLEDLYQILGDRRITLCREMTKIHEEIQRSTLSQAAAEYRARQIKPKGEFVLVVEGAPPPSGEPVLTVEEAVLIARQKVAAGMRPTDACRETAKETGLKKGELYALLSQG